MRHKKKQENMTSTREKKPSIETDLEETKTVDYDTKFSVSYFELKGPKEAMPKELKESVRMMSHQKENINWEITMIKKKQIEIRELKNNTEMKNAVEELNIGFELVKNSTLA